MDSRGFFIIFEGIDKVGKSTQVKLLQNVLPNSEIYVFPNRSTKIGKIISKYLTREISLTDESVHLLFSANRWEMNNIIMNKLKNGITVIADRYMYSGIAYTSAKGLSIEWCSNSDVGLLIPDVIFYLDASNIDTECRNEFGNECYETFSFQQKVLTQYDLLKTDEWCIIDASLSIDEIHNIVFEKLINEYII